jgi:hypothetical protein
VLARVASHYLLSYLMKPCSITLDQTNRSSHMNLKSLLYLVPVMVLCATLSTAVTTKAADADPEASPAASAPATPKLSPDVMKARRLARLKNLVGLTPDQEASAKPIIDQFVDDYLAAKGDKAKQKDVQTKYSSDIYGILNPDQQKKFAVARNEAKAKIKAAHAAKAAKEGASVSPAPAKTN